MSARFLRRVAEASPLEVTVMASSAWPSSRKRMAAGRAKLGKSADWREVGGKSIYFRSRWEANYARWLQLLQEQRKIRCWAHEPKTFWFEGIKRGVCSYLPDFEVIRLDGSVEYHEVKGWMTPRSQTALKRMAKYHPEVKLVVVDKVEYARLSRDVKFVVPGWEGVTPRRSR